MRLDRKLRLKYYPDRTPQGKLNIVESFFFEKIYVAEKSFLSLDWVDFQVALTLQRQTLQIIGTGS